MAVAVLVAAATLLQPARARGLGAKHAGARILFASAWSGTSQIYAVDPTAGAVSGQLTVSPAACASPHACGATDPFPSPDGRRLLYRVGDGSLWLARGDGRGPRRIWPQAGVAAALVEAAVWSPDSTRFAYVVDDAHTGARSVHVVAGDGAGDRIVQARASVGRLSWSADSRHVSVSSAEGVSSPDGHWFAVYSDSGLVVEKTDSSATVHRLGVSAFPTWSPDSRLLAYASPRGLRVLDMRSGKTRQLTHEIGFDLAWSPDGRTLAYLQGRGSEGGYPWMSGQPLTGDLRTVTLGGRVRTVVAANGAFGGPIFSFAWTRTPPGLHYRAPGAVDGAYAGWGITALAADGDRVAYSTCAGVSVWNTATATVTQAGQLRLGFQCDPSANYETVFSLALAEDRVAYSTAYGGNTTVWWVGGTLLAPTLQPFELDKGDETCCLTNPEVAGGGGLLVFDARHDAATYPNLNWQIQRVGKTGCPCTVLTEFQHQIGDEVHLDDVDADRIVVDRPDYLRILNSDGGTLLALPVHSREAVLSGSNLVVHSGTELRVYDAASGALLHTWQPPGLQPPPSQPRRDPADHALQDTARGLAAYTLDNQIHLLRLADGKDTTVGPGTLARFMTAGLVYADGTRVHLVPYDRLPLR